MVWTFIGHAMAMFWICFGHVVGTFKACVLDISTTKHLAHVYISTKSLLRVYVLKAFFLDVLTLHLHIGVDL